MPRLFGKSVSPLGLDISDLSLKFIQFQKERDRYFGIQAYSEVLLPSEFRISEKIQNPGLLAEVLKKAFARPLFGKALGSEVIASIPESKSFVRVIQIPKMSEDEAKEAVPWEAEAYIPLPLSQVYLDWAILDRSNLGLNSHTESQSKLLTVLISASPKDYVDDLVLVLENAGLTPLALEVESQATARSLVTHTDETVLIADMDTLRTSLIIYDHEILQFTSSLPIAGRGLTESIAQAYGVTFEEAEKIKQAQGIDPNAQKGKLKKALLPVLNNLVEEIKNTIRFFEEHAPSGRRIEKLLLSGSSSKLKHLPSFLKTSLAQKGATEKEHFLRSLPDLKVELGNPWVNVLQKGQTPPLSREDSLSYATAIGLAIRESRG